MKIRLIVFALLICNAVIGQTPSLFLKMAATGTTYGMNIPKGTLLVDLSTNKRYLVLTPLAASKSISSSNKLLLDGITVDPSGTTAEIKEVGTNSSSHYIGEIVDGGIVVVIWTELGIEKVLLAKLTDEAPMAWASATNDTDPATWSLPTIWESNALFNSSLIVNTVLKGTGEFKPEMYWSSTVSTNPAFSCAKQFLDGPVTDEDPTGILNVRYVKIHQ